MYIIAICTTYLILESHVGILRPIPDPIALVVILFVDGHNVHTVVCVHNESYV